MHGRVKVRTTEEQNAIKRKEREEKVKKYKIIWNKIVEYKNNHVYNEKVLELTANILLSNPDIISCWNYRRQIFTNLKQQTEDYQNVLEKDLILTEQCLRVNPKSYGSWHHRIWILENIPNPNWSKELQICTKYLEFDERNFHTWDYRKIICEKSNIPELDEYEYTTQKITVNFSNYSSWHYRSKLLPKIFPDENHKLPINNEKHKEELELVLNAAFTDPDDTSAWFYQRWLLGLVDPPVHIVGADVQATKVVVYLSKCISLKYFNSLSLVREDGKDLTGKWESSAENGCSKMWTFYLDQKWNSEDNIHVQLYQNKIQISQLTIPANQQSIITLNNLNPELNESYREVLKEQLSACEELLTLEPDSKWTLLTSTFLMKYINFTKYFEKIKESIDTLTKVDSTRLGYYLDLMGKFNVEYVLLLQDMNKTTKINLSVLNLFNLYHSQYLFKMKIIDLSNNNLINNVLKQFHVLISCRELILDCNLISSLDDFPELNNLEILSLKENPINKNDQFLNLNNLKQIIL